MDIGIQQTKNLLEDPFSFLPDEILYSILNWLDCETLCLLSRVNSRWKLLCYQQCWWHRLDFSSHHNSITTQMVRNAFEKNSNLSYTNPHRFSKITTLSFRGCKHLDDDVLFVVGSTCNNLQKIDLRECAWVSVHGLRTLLTSYCSTIQLIDCRNSGISEPSSLWELSECFHVWQDSFVKCFTLDELDRFGLVSIQAQKRKSYFISNGKRRLTIYGGCYEEPSSTDNELDASSKNSPPEEDTDRLASEIPAFSVEAFVDDEVTGGAWELVFVEVTSQALDTYFEMYSQN